MPDRTGPPHRCQSEWLWKRFGGMKDDRSKLLTDALAGLLPYGGLGAVVSVTFGRKLGHESSGRATSFRYMWRLVTSIVRSISYPIIESSPCYSSPRLFAFRRFKIFPYLSWLPYFCDYRTTGERRMTKPRFGFLTLSREQCHENPPGVRLWSNTNPFKSRRVAITMRYRCTLPSPCQRVHT
jgi:hypothetical protein